MALDIVMAACTLPGLWHHLISALAKNILERVDLLNHSLGYSWDGHSVVVLSNFEYYCSSVGGAL